MDMKMQYKYGNHNGDIVEYMVEYCHSVMVYQWEIMDRKPTHVEKG